MTREETIKVLGDLHCLGLANEPKNHNDLVYSWMAFFHQDDFRVINKACYIYTKIRGNRFFPTPGDIELLKQRAKWLVEMEDEEQKKLNSIKNAIMISKDIETFCDLCGLCEIRDQEQCPCDF
jgi:hypothetical protein